MDREDVFTNELKGLAAWIADASEKAISSDVSTWDSLLSTSSDFSVTGACYHMQHFFVVNAIEQLLRTERIGSNYSYPYQTISIIEEDNYITLLLLNVQVLPISTRSACMSFHDFQVCESAFSTIFRYISQTFSRFEIRGSDTFSFVEHMDFVLAAGSIQVMIDPMPGFIPDVTGTLLNYCSRSYTDSFKQKMAVAKVRQIIKEIVSKLKKT